MRMRTRTEHRGANTAGSFDVVVFDQDAVEQAKAMVGSVLSMAII
jgi:hypothetical protein